MLEDDEWIKTECSEFKLIFINEFLPLKRNSGILIQIDKYTLNHWYEFIGTNNYKAFT
jgi:hypothetical protein